MKITLLVISILCGFLFFVGLITIISLSVKQKNVNYYEWLSLIISLAALSVSVLSIWWAKLSQQENDYKKFAIDLLEKKRDSIDYVLKNIHSAMERNLRFDESVFTEKILTCCLFSKVFQSYYFRFSEQINKYNLLLKAKQIGKNKDSEIFDVTAEFNQLRVFFSEEISELIKKIYQGDLKVKEIM